MQSTDRIDVVGVIDSAKISSFQWRRRRAGRYARDTQFRRLKRVVKRQRTILGIVTREVQRKLESPNHAPDFVPDHPKAVSNLMMWLERAELPIEGKDGRPEIHNTRIYRAFRRWVADGCFDSIFTGSVLTLAQHDLLDKTVVHGDGTTTAAKKGGDNIGFNGHKRTKGDKVIPSVIATDWPLRWRKGRGTGT